MSTRFPSLAALFTCFAVAVCGVANAQDDAAPDASAPSAAGSDAPPHESPSATQPPPSAAPEPTTLPPPPPPTAAEPRLAPAPSPPAPAAAAEPSTYGAHAISERLGPSQTPRYGTGSRQGVPLEELPATVSVIDARTLRVRGVNNLDEALTLTPGVMPLWEYGGFLHLNLRGLQAVTLFDGYRDSRSIFADSAPQQGLFDLERIEVLRGPSSVLYGYGAVGGVVNLIRKTPSRVSETELEAGLGLPNQRLLHAGSQGAINDWLSYRVDVGHMERTDYRGASTDRNQVSTALRFTPTSKHTFDLRLSYARDHYSTDVGIPTVEDPNNPGHWVLPPYTRTRNNYGTANDHLDYQRFDVSGDYRYDVARNTFVRAHAGIARDDYAYLASESLTYLPAMGTTPASVARDYLPFKRGWLPIVGQLELHSEQSTGPISHNFVIGYEIDHFGGTTHNQDTGDAVPGPVDFAHPVDHSNKLAVQDHSINHYDHLTHSVYAFDHIKLLESLIVTGGLRFDTVRSQVSKDRVDPATAEKVPDPMTGDYATVLRTHREAVTGQIGAVYNPWKPLTAYVGYSSSFKPLFVDPGEVEDNHYEPERGQQVEGGLRARFDIEGHRIDFDGAIYWIEKRNVLVAKGADAYTQAGKVRSEGLDFALNYHAPEYIDLAAGYSFNDATYRNFVEPDPITGENASLKGKQLDFAPRHMATAWLGVRMTRQIGVGFGGRFMAKQFADPENRVAMPDYALVDTSAWYDAGRVSFVLSVRNLFDRQKYFTSAINTWAPGPQVTPGPGREVLGTLRVKL